MKKEILEQLSWEDLEEITETDDSLWFEDKLQDEWPAEWVSTPELYIL